jgi:putative ABC transport system permease protein
MFVRLVYESFRRQRRRKLLAGAAVALGAAVATAMIAVATDIGDKVNRELRSYGANLVVYPQEDTLDVEAGGVNLKPASEGAYLSEADLPKIKGIFWRHNVMAFAPLLPLQAEVSSGAGTQKAAILGTYFNKELTLGKEQFSSSIRALHPWWKVTGAWPADDSDQVLVRTELAARLKLKPGDEFQIAGRSARVAGILDPGDSKTEAVVVPLALAQEIAERPGAVRRVLVSALTKPEDAFARRDPASMSPADRDAWYCSPYANSIALQLSEAIPHSQAEQIRQVAQNEGTVLTRIEGLMLLVTLAALLASALAVSAAMTTAMLQRRREVGLMKALGAGNGTVAAVFLAESAILALLGGGVGLLAGMAMARQIGLSVFGSSIHFDPVLLPLVLGLAVLVTFAGSAAAVRRALLVDPVIVLRGDA